MNVKYIFFQNYFYKVRGDLKGHPYGDIEDRVLLRQRLGCKSFKWYLDNVYPEQTLPDDKGKYGQPKGAVLPVKLNPKPVRKGHVSKMNHTMCITEKLSCFIS